MIEKMNFLSITGPKADIDRVVNTYLCKYEIHLENALSELTTVESLTPFLDVNPYRDALNSINTIYEELKTPPSTSNISPGIETALSTVKEIRSQADQLQKEQSELEEKCSSLEESLRIIRPFRNIDYDISSILHLKYIHFHFGRIEKQYYEKFKKYIYDNLNTIFLNAMKMTNTSGAFTSYRSMMRTKLMPPTLLCTLKRSLCRIIIPELPSRHFQA